MLRRQPVIERQSPDLRGASSLRNHMAVADERADHIATAVQPHQCGVACVVRGGSPFRPHPVRRHRLDRDVGGYFVLERAGVHVLAPLPQILRTHPACQLLPQRTNLGIAHVFLPVPSMRHPSTGCSTRSRDYALEGGLRWTLAMSCSASASHCCSVPPSASSGNGASAWRGCE